MLRCDQTATLPHRPRLPRSHKTALAETEKAFLTFFPANRFLANWEEQVVATASTNAAHAYEVGDINNLEREMERTLLVVASQRSSAPAGCRVAYFT